MLEPSSFLAPPTPGADVATPPARCLLVGSPACAVPSLIFQHALNRARNELTTLVVLCGPPDATPTARPRASALDTGAADAATAAALLDMVHVKHVARWNELRELLMALPFYF